MEIPQEIEAALQDVYAYASHNDSWIVLKRELLNSLPPRLRGQFSTRHPVTKRTQTNDLELALAERWSELTGRPVIFKDDEGKTGSETPP